MRELVAANMLKKPKLNDDHSAAGDHWHKRLKERYMKISRGADIARITRKEPKPDKNEHENGKSTQELGIY
nr:hypothetical protein [Tanacetum cinerariifolium]